MRFSVVIPHWNGLEHLPVCLAALNAQTCRDFEVLLADNASSDGSQDYVRSHHPWVKLIQLERNAGFTGACNAGMRAAQGEIVVLLNNDTEVAPNWLDELAAAFDRHPEAGAVASRMLLFDRRDTFHTAGDLFCTSGTAANRGVWQRDTGQFDEGYVFSACGGSSAYRKSMLDRVGLLDDDFFFSQEDVDLSWRAQLQGFKTVYAPSAVVYHKLSASGGGTTASFYDGRNAIYVLVKNLPTPLWRKYRAKIIARQWAVFSEALQHWRGAAARATLRGQFTGLLHIPRLLRKRAAIQATRTVPIDDLDALLTDC